MSTTGLCVICDAQAQHRCENCGQFVCEEHYEKEYGRCVECVAGGGPGGQQPGGPNSQEGGEEFQL